MRIGSLCTGYGGIELGLTLAGEDVDLRWYAEIESPLRATLRDVWHPGVPNLGDITVADWRTAEPVDLIVGGIPCQPTSAAGRRLGDADPRWLWPAARAALEVLRPARFLLENVRGLVGFEKGRLFDGILSDLVALGYDVRWLTVGACAVGLAHHRHRVFVLAEHSDAPTIQRLDADECGARRGQHRSRAATPSATPYGYNQGGANPGGPARHSLDMLVTLLPTPTSRDAVGSRNATANREPGSKAHAGVTLTDAFWLLPTPTARGGGGRGTPSAETADARFAAGRRNLDDALALLPTPRATDGVNGGPNQAGRRSEVPDLRAVQPQRWAQFGDAIVRHALATGVPPCEPTEPNRNGAPRLRAEFVEWLMAVPTGHVTNHLDRKSALKALGNGVSPPQLAQAWRLLTDRQRINYPAPAGMKSTKGRNTRMATTEATREAFERKAAQRRAAIEAAHHVIASTGADQTAIAAALHAGIAAMVAAWRDDAAAEVEKARRGWKSRSEFLQQAAAEAAGFAGGLTSPEFLASLAPAQTGNAPAVAAVEDIALEVEQHKAEIQAFIRGDAPDLPGPRIPGAIGPGDRPTDVVIHDPGAVAHFTITKAGTVIQNVEMVSIEPTTALGVPAFLDPPVGPKRLSWDDFALVVEAIQPSDRVSFSSITALAECGMKYALDKSTKEVPAWWLVGGTAFHLATEELERTILERPADWAAIPDEQMPEILRNGWHNALAKAIAERQVEALDVPLSDWRAANKGMEGYDWWRVTGADMLARYVAYWAPRREKGWRIYTMPDGQPALELDLSIDVDGERFQVIIDQVWRTPNDDLWIDDLKSGKTSPASTLQLGIAAHALAAEIPTVDLPANTIHGAFYKAREGSHDKETADLLAAHPWSEIRHLARSAMTMIRGKAYLPRVSDFGGGCSSCGHKAICPARG